MPAFFVIAIAAGALTVGATATDAKRWTQPDPKTAEAFYQTTFESKAECLTAAALVQEPASACGSEQN